MWFTRWQRCNYFCIGLSITEFLILLGHYGFMIVPLHGWAEGSIPLVLITIQTTFDTIFSVMLMDGEPLWMMAPRWMRMMNFIHAAFTVTSFIGQFIYIVIGYMTGRSFFTDFSTLILAYMFIVRFTDFVPCVYILLFDGLGQSDYSLYSPNYGKWRTEGIKKVNATRDDPTSKML